MKTLFLLLLFASTACAYPFMVSDPSAVAVGGGYEIFEITTAYPDGRLVYSANNQPDGSISMDLNEVPVGTHKWKVRYVKNGEYSTFVGCVLVVSSLYYKSEVKTFRYYSVTKSWALKVPK